MAFTSRKSKPQRIKNPQEERPYKCDSCDFAYSLPGALEKHKACHSGVQPKCEYCQKKFPTFHKLRNHMKIHIQALKKFQCDICGRKYMTTQGLDTHKSAHTQEFQCDECDSRYDSERAMKKHKKRRHRLKKTYRCDLCDFTSETLGNMKRHVRKEHERKANQSEAVQS